MRKPRGMKADGWNSRGASSGGMMETTFWVKTGKNMVTAKQMKMAAADQCNFLYRVHMLTTFRFACSASSMLVMELTEFIICLSMMRLCLRRRGMTARSVTMLMPVAVRKYTKADRTFPLSIANLTSVASFEFFGAGTARTEAICATEGRTPATACPVIIA